MSASMTCQIRTILGMEHPSGHVPSSSLASTMRKIAAAMRRDCPQHWTPEFERKLFKILGIGAGGLRVIKGEKE